MKSPANPSDDRRIVERDAAGVEGRVDYVGEYRVVLPDGMRWIAAGAGDSGRKGSRRGWARRSTSPNAARRRRCGRRGALRGVANTAPVMIWMSGTDKLQLFQQSRLDFTGRPLEKTGQWLGRGVHQTITRRAKVRRILRCSNLSRCITDCADTTANISGFHRRAALRPDKISGIHRFLRGHDRTETCGRNSGWWCKPRPTA